MLDLILEEAKKNRKSDEKLDNILFLDFDGVINISINNYKEKKFSKNCVNNVNRLCKKYNFKIVVISSWKEYVGYKEMLYDAGLSESIPVVGKTDRLESSRETEIMKYLLDHPNIAKFLILDDGYFYELSKYQIKTDISKGFNEGKFREAIILMENLKSNE